MSTRTTLLTLSALLAAACSEQPAPQQAAAPTAEPAVAAKPADVATDQAEASEAEKLATMFDDHFEANLKLNPLQATFIGDPRYNDRMENFLAADYRQRAGALDREYLQRAEAIDASKLGEQDQLSLKMFIQNRKDSIEGEKYPGHLIPINQFFNITNFFAQLGSGSSAQPFATVEDYENWLSRVDGFITVMDQAIDNMHDGIEAGVVQPKILMEKVLPQLDAHVVETAADSLFYGPVNNFPEDFSDEDKARFTEAYEAMITDKVVPAYTRMSTFLRDEYIPAARDTVGMYALPGGDEWYAFNVRQTTTTDLTPEQIHQIGLDEVDRIHNEMRQVMAEVGFEGDLTEFFAYTKEDPQFYYDERDELLQAYRDFRSTVDALTPKLFEVFPKSDYEVRAVEAFREQSSSAASYQRASPDGSRPGIFYVNTYDLSARPSWSVESLFLHEAAPGHHFQIAIQQELEGLPNFRRFGGYTAYIEGWGLYAESLGKELGVYTDPYQYFGALAAELWRAIRLVVDTGIHAKGWTRAQVLEYMYANAPVAEARAVSEAERFMAIPSQALAYKIGQLKIREMRDRAEAQLGDQFDVRKFHTEVLKYGALPLNIFEQTIDQWIAQQLAE